MHRLANALGRDMIGRSTARCGLTAPRCARIGSAAATRFARTTVQTSTSTARFRASGVAFSTSAARASDEVPPQGQARPSDAPVVVTFGEVSQAAYRIHSGVHKTSVHRSRKLSQLLGMTVYCKNEFEHPTGSFKERGGRNALLMLPEDVRRRGVIAASAGNHALALSYHGQELGVPVTVVMPVTAPITKVQNCKDLNARVMIHGKHIGEAREYAMTIAAQDGSTYVHGFDDPNVSVIHYRADAALATPM